ncbi:MAG: tetratricopeptide repeat protein [Acidobacteriaceae bacterium]
MQTRDFLLGTVFLLAAASFVAGKTARPAANAVPGTGRQSETGAIFSDRTVASIAQLTAPKKANVLYLRGVRALQAGRVDEAARDAEQSIQAGARFSDVYALAATAELSQRDFVQAQSTARAAIHADSSSIKAYVVLATADNYLGQYADAVTALAPVQDASGQWWQIAYQQARAEAGLENAQAALEWSNRAALQAPAGFAPLHLLHASALAALAQYAQAAEELEIYLQLEGDQAPQRAALQKELEHLRQLAQRPAQN